MMKGTIDYAEKCPAFQKKNGSVKAWLSAFRPRTLPLSLTPVLVGIALAAGQIEHIDWPLIGYCLSCILAIQIGTNLVNDALDFKKGADGEGRMGPKRMTQEGLLSFKQVMRAAYLFFCFPLFFTIPLLFHQEWTLAALLLIATASGYLYTGGPWPLGYIGVSDLFILIGFGWVSTGAVYYLQTGKFELSTLVAGTQIGLLAIVPHAINNLRDKITDVKVNKKTLAVRFGSQFVLWEITLFTLIPYCLALFWLINGNIWVATLPLLTMPMAISNLRSIWCTAPGPKYNQFLAKSAINQVLFGCMLTLGALL